MIHALIFNVHKPYENIAKMVHASEICELTIIQDKRSYADFLRIGSCMIATFKSIVKCPLFETVLDLS